MYSSERIKNIVKKDTTYLSAGIHDNLSLEQVRISTYTNGNEFIEFKFVDPTGKFVTHTEGEPKQFPNETAEAFQNRLDTQFSRIDQILECYYPNDDDRKFEGESFHEFILWVQDMYNKADKSTKLRVKIVYNDKGYLKLPTYAKFTFIEPMRIVEEGKSVIKQLGMDIFTKPVIADVEEAPNSFAMSTVDSSPKVTDGELVTNDDLPF